MTVERKDLKSTIRGDIRWMICANNDFFLSVPIDVANHGWSGNVGEKVFRPAGSIDEFHAVPPAETDFIPVREAEDINMIVVIGVDGNHDGAVQPAIIVDKIRARSPLAPKKSAIIVEDRFVGGKQVAPLRSGNEHFIETVSIDIGDLDIDPELIGTGH